MARHVSLYEAKTHLSRLVEEAAKGETSHHRQGRKADGKARPHEAQAGRRRAGSDNSLDVRATSIGKNGGGIGRRPTAPSRLSSKPAAGKPFPSRTHNGVGGRVDENTRRLARRARRARRLRPVSSLRPPRPSAPLRVNAFFWFSSASSASSAVSAADRLLGERAAESDRDAGMESRPRKELLD